MQQTNKRDRLFTDYNLSISKMPQGPMQEIRSRFQQEAHRLQGLPVNQQRKLERQWKRSLTGIALSLALGSSALGVLPVRAAASIVVNSETDVVADDGLCTLREAILNANTDSQLSGTSGECAAGSGTDEIRFDGTVFGTAKTITLQSGELTISNDLTITGPGVDLLTINGNHLSRIFMITDPENNSIKNVTLSDLTISGGNAGTNSGGGIYNMENLVLNRAVITGNQAGFGAGIFSIGNSYAGLTINNTTISDNSAQYGGGGIGLYAFNQNSINLSNITISGNTAPHSGGLFFFGFYSALTASELTIINNSADTIGAGVRIDGINNTINITETTISGNHVLGNSDTVGGGAAIFNTMGSVTLDTNTVTDNSAINTKEEAKAKGGGLFVINTGIFTLKNSILDGNIAQSADSYNGTGGGVWIGTYNSTQTSIENVQITNNTGSYIGGGLYGLSEETNFSMVNLTISGNHGGIGGGAFIRNDSSGSFSLRNSLISGNSAVLDGGGLFFYNGLDSSVVIDNSTISGNNAQSRLGGGIFLNTHSNQAFIINHCTITDNHSGFFGGGLVGANNTKIELKNSILAENSATNGNPDLQIIFDPEFTFFPEYSLIGDNTGTDLTEAPLGSPDTNGNLIGGPTNGFIDPLLGSLAENNHPDGDGSRTLSHTLLSGSPALDAIPLAACMLTEDQRGVPRPQGEACDMGALEAAPFFVFMPLTLR